MKLPISATLTPIQTYDEVLKLDFDRHLMLQFRGSAVTSDAGLLTYRELDDALGLSAMAGETLADTRTGKNGRHALGRELIIARADRLRESALPPIADESLQCSKTSQWASSRRVDRSKGQRIKPLE